MHMRTSAHGILVCDFACLRIHMLGLHVCLLQHKDIQCVCPVREQACPEHMSKCMHNSGQGAVKCLHDSGQDADSWHTSCRFLAHIMPILGTHHAQCPQWLPQVMRHIENKSKEGPSSRPTTTVDTSVVKGTPSSPKSAYTYSTRSAPTDKALPRGTKTLDTSLFPKCNHCLHAVSKECLPCSDPLFNTHAQPARHLQAPHLCFWKTERFADSGCARLDRLPITFGLRRPPSAILVLPPIELSCRLAALLLCPFRPSASPCAGAYPHNLAGGL